MLGLAAFPPTWREATFPLEGLALARSAVWRLEGVRHGGDRPVLLIPGYFVGDGSLGLLTTWLRAAGYRTRRAGIGINAACSEVACGQLERHLEELVAARGQQVALVGQSRGGVLAKTLACARPDLVSGIVTLGAPTVPRLPSSPLLIGHGAAAAALARGHLPGLSRTCLTGACGDRYRTAMAGPFPSDVGYVSIYSRTDGIVDWRACRHPAAMTVEVASTHTGMALNPEAYRAIGRALETFADADPGFSVAS